MPQLGLGLGLHKGSMMLSPYQKLVKSASWMVEPYRASGLPRVPLSPRTLPNGVSNGEYTPQNVSVDVVLQASDITLLNTSPVFMNLVELINPSNSYLSTSSTGLQNQAVIGEYVGKGLADDVSNINTWFKSSVDQKFKICLPKTITTLAQAQALLAGTVIRYQLATPIDTLNSPFVNPMVDLSGVVGKNLADLPRYFSVGRYATTVSCFADLKPNTTYTISVVIPNGETHYVNENLFNFDTIDGDGTRKNITVTTIGNISKSNANQWMEGFGWIVLKNFNPTITSGNASQLQLELGSVATAYEPYGKANVLLQGFAGNSADGYVSEVVNGVGDEISYSNLVVNPWTATASTVSVIGGVVSVTGNGANNAPRATTLVSFQNNKSNYISMRVRVTNPSCAELSLLNDVGNVLFQKNNPTMNEWYNIDVLRTSTSETLLRLFHYYSDAPTSNGKVAEIEFPQVVQTSDNPQIQALEAKLGRQLTIAECDYLFSFTPTTATVKAKTVIGLKADGVDSYGIMSAT